MRLILFGTSGCHLCEQAESIINACVRDGVEYVDIAEQEQWQEQYAVRIPVLYHPETRQELGWPFDQAGVKEFINRLKPLLNAYKNESD
ncbi:MAG: glutaredoxin family protein [Methylobacter sp.]|jgi:short subunit dehydrogenase-like uncharacterized protein